MGAEIVSQVEALLPCPPERVWAVVTDLERCGSGAAISAAWTTPETMLLRSTAKAAFPPASPSRTAVRPPSGPLT